MMHERDNAQSHRFVLDLDWQCAELTRLTASCGGREGRPLPDDTWPRLETAARAAFPAAAAVMAFSVLPSQVADLMEDWVDNGAADGFNVMPPLLPLMLEVFTREREPQH
jgi:alkanesulfonate monooxygenase SsuD/methylene tetrahydromethanopterin reductase-like flavin-dependent oxidoreductase (luciferase family)